MAFMTRSVTCTIDNQTDYPLRLSSNKDVHGSLDTPIPATIAARRRGAFKASTAGFMTGAEGWAVFEIMGASVMFEVNWNNPFIGDNKFDRALRALGSGDASLFEALPADGNDLEDADDVVVTFTLKMVPQEAKDAGGGAIAQARPPESPPPDPEAPQAVNATPSAPVQVSAVGAVSPPRLSIALNLVDPDETEKDPSIPASLAIIAKRLEGGLEPVWKKGAAMGLWDATKWKETDPEEQWARAITELLLGLTYNGSAAIYGKPNLDGIFYKPFSDPGAEPIAPLAAACQHLATFGVLSRGYTYQDLLEVGLSCNDASAMPLFKGGSWSKSDSKKSLATAIEEGLRPGSVYVFNPKPTSSRQLEGSHIAFVLRVDKDQKKAQFFDTGGLHHPERVSGPVPYIMTDFKAKGSYDDPLWDNVGTEYYIGMGVPKAPGDLSAQVARLRKTRPVGFARLVFTARGAKFEQPIDKNQPPSDLLFVSRLLRMYGDAADQNFTIARYYWSLRNLPNTSEVQAYWVFYAPMDVALAPDAPADKKARAAYARAVMTAPRSKKVDEFATPFHKDSWLVIGNMADGKVKQVQRKFTKAANNDPGSTAPATSFTEVEPPGAFPPNLQKLLDSLPAKQAIALAAPALPALFNDYA